MVKVNRQLQWLFRKLEIFKTAVIIVAIVAQNFAFGVLISGVETPSRALPEPSVTEKGTSFSNNSGLTDHQRIKLKEIRKLARLAGHEQPEVITEVTNKTCYKDDCLDAAKEFYESMDFSQSPCDTWKKFACEWRTLSSGSSLDQVSSLSLKVQDQVYDILTDYETESEIIHLAQSYFESCIEWFGNDLSKREGIASYIDSVGNWPLLSGKANSGNTEWIKVLIEIFKVLPDNAPSPFLKFDVVAFKNKLVFKLESGLTSFDIDYDDLNILLKFLRKAPPKSESSEIQMFEDMQKLVNHLSAASFQVSAISTDELEMSSLQSLQDQLKVAVPDFKLNIIELLSSVFEHSDIKISPEMEILTDVKALINYFITIDSSDPTELLNILFLHLIVIVLGDTTNFLEVLNLNGMQNYKRLLSRHPTRQCLKETSEVFSYALTDEYIYRYFKEDNAIEVNKTIGYLKDGFLSTIDSIKWLGTEAKNFIRERIMKMMVYVGYPNVVKNATWMQALYSRHKELISSKSYVQHRLSILSWLNGKYWTMKLKNEPSDIWNLFDKNAFVGDVNVEYVSLLNQLRIPAGAIQLPLFSKEFPGFMNFGGLGSVIAKEMTRLLDLNGIFQSNDEFHDSWMDEKSFKSYTDWTKRLQRDWDDDEISLNDKITRVFSYHTVVRGYEKYLKDNKEDIELPGLSIFSPEKLLHVKFTNLLCESKPVKRLRMEKEYSLDYDRNYNSGGFLPITRSSLFRKLFGCETGNIGIGMAFDFM